MTRSRERGENEFTRAAKREALRTGVPATVVLARMLAAAKRAKDVASQEKIIQALKFVRERNRRKRRGGQ